MTVAATVGSNTTSASPPSSSPPAQLTMAAVDFFRHNPNARRPLACFLSHVHSDHLAGLDSLKSPL